MKLFLHGFRISLSAGTGTMISSCHFHYNQIFFQLPQLLNNFLRKSVPLWIPLVRNPTHWTVGEPVSAFGANEVFLGASKDGNVCSLKAHRALQTGLFLLDCFLLLLNKSLLHLFKPYGTKISF